jgi:hypothetical protein
MNREGEGVLSESPKWIPDAQRSRRTTLSPLSRMRPQAPRWERGTAVAKERVGDRGAVPKLPHASPSAAKDLSRRNLAFASLANGPLAEESTSPSVAASLVPCGIRFALLANELGP